MCSCLKDCYANCYDTLKNEMMLCLKNSHTSVWIFLICILDQYTLGKGEMTNSVSVVPTVYLVLDDIILLS